MHVAISMQSAKVSYIAMHLHSEIPRAIHTDCVTRITDKMTNVAS